VNNDAMPQSTLTAGPSPSIKHVRLAPRQCIARGDDRDLPFLRLRFQQLHAALEDRQELLLFHLGASCFPKGQNFTTQLTGGYQLARRIEVGPKVVIGPEGAITPAFATIPANPQALICAQAQVCTARVGPAKVAYESAHQLVSPRGAM
jgi:hypothetical protein